MEFFKPEAEEAVKMKEVATYVKGSIWKLPDGSYVMGMNTPIAPNQIVQLFGKRARISGANESFHLSELYAFEKEEEVHNIDMFLVIDV